jgi:hypothetical protein
VLKTPSLWDDNDTVLEVECFRKTPSVWDALWQTNVNSLSGNGHLEDSQRVR